MRWLGVFAVLVTLFAWAAGPSGGKAHHLGPFLPQLPTQAQKALMERGYGLYALTPAASAYPGFRASLWRVYGDECERSGICWREAAYGTTVDLVHDMPEAWPYGGGVVGVAYYTLYPAVVEYNRYVLYTSYATTQGHEQGHVDGQHEEYFDDGRLACNYAATYTRMSCGTGVWWLTSWDRDIIWNVYVPDRPAFLAVDTGGGWATVYWGLRRASGASGHFSAYNDNATRLAFGWASRHGEPVAWVGELTEPFWSKYEDYQRGFDSFWRGCLYVRAENAAVWWVPQLSAPDYWSLAGCW